mgnify:CR=1 FL=1
MADFFRKFNSYFVAAATIISTFFCVLSAQTTVFADLSYGTSASQKIDIYLPKDTSACSAVIVYIHGGGWIEGDKGKYAEKCRNAAEDGYAAVTMNYRLTSEGADWKDMLDDITSVLKLVKTIAAGKGITLKRAALSGASSGGNLSMLYAYRNKNISPLKIVFCASQSGPSDFSDINYFKQNSRMYSLVSGLIGRPFNKNTFMQVASDLKAASPVHYITENSPPTLIAQGRKDATVLYTQATDVYKAMTKAGAVCDLVLYPNSGHKLTDDPECCRHYYKLFKEYETKYFGY